MTSLPLPPEMCPKCGRAEVADLKFDVERLEKAVDVLAASVNAATIRAEKAEAEVAALRERVADLEGQLAMRGTP